MNCSFCEVTLRERHCVDGRRVFCGDLCRSVHRALRQQSEIWEPALLVSADPAESVQTTDLCGPAGDANPAMTLEEIGAELGVTRERVRQIEMRALEKLRLRCRALRAEWLDGEPSKRPKPRAVAPTPRVERPRTRCIAAARQAPRYNTAARIAINAMREARAARGAA